MFTLFSRGLSSQISARKRKQEIWKKVGRIIDRAAAQSAMISKEQRKDKRIPISMPVLVQPYSEDSTDRMSPVYALTKDISEEGMAIIVDSALPKMQIFCGLWCDGPLCFVGCIRQCRSIGGGFYHIGIEFDELVNVADWDELRPAISLLQPEL